MKHKKGSRSAKIGQLEPKTSGKKMWRGPKVSQKMAYLWCLIPVGHLQLQELKNVCSAYVPNDGS